MVGTRFKGENVTRVAVISAMRGFNTEYPDTNMYDNWLEKRNYKYAVLYEGRRYPPKHILSQVTGIPTDWFTGGWETNRVFINLGFQVVEKFAGGAA